MTPADPPVLTVRRAATRQALIRAAIRVFSERGLNAVPVEDICDAAGFTRGAFYSNFDSREALHLAILESLLDQTHQAGRLVQQQLGALAASPGPGPRADQPGSEPAGVLDLALRTFLGAARMDRNHVLILTELRLLAAREPAIRAAIQRLDAEFRPLFTSLVVAAVEHGGLRLTLPPEEVVGILQSVYEGAQLDIVVHGAEPDDDVLERRLGAVLRAFVAPNS